MSIGLTEEEYDAEWAEADKIIEGLSAKIARYEKALREIVVMSVECSNDADTLGEIAEEALGEDK